MLALSQQRAVAGAAASSARRPGAVGVMGPLPSPSCCCSRRPSAVRPLARAAAQKGFGGGAPAPPTPPASDAGTSSSSSGGAEAPPPRARGRDDDAALEALEARLKSRRAAAAKLEPRVKVESAAVKLGTGQAPGSAGGAAETLFVQFLGALFLLILVEGLVLAASGFLPEEADAAVSEWLYPSYSPQILLFLGMSSLYGLFKTGKLPGQKQL